jgi:hypothetical protein
MNNNQNQNQVQFSQDIDSSSFNKAFPQQNQSSNKYIKPKHRNKVDPYTIQMIIYRAEMYILNVYPHLIDLNKR